MGKKGGMRSADTNSFAQAEQQRVAAAKLAESNRQLEEQKALRGVEAARGPGYIGQETNQFERQAGVNPPGYEGLRDRTTGKLLDQYKINPFAGEASQKLRQEALSTGPSDFAKGQLGQQGFEEGQARNAAGLQQQTAQSNAQSQLARMGGLGGGARTSLARSGARDALMAGQNVGAQGVLARYGINNQDMQRRQTLLGQNADVERASDLQNLNTTTGDIQNRGLFDSNRYNQQMQAWAAKQSGDATIAAAKKSGGGKK